MPVNPGIDYKLAEEEYRKATTNFEKIKALEHMYATCPKHKGAHSLLQEIKTKLSKLREKVSKEKEKKSGYSFHIKKEGAAQVFIVGPTNTGKSTILKQLTNTKPTIAEYEYTTKKPEMGILDHFGVKVQLIEMPAIFDGFSDRGKGPTYFATMRNADLIVIILDGEKPLGKQLKLIETEFHKSFIHLDGKEDGKDKVIGIKCLITINKKFKRPKTKYKICKPKDLAQRIWKELKLIYVYTKSPGKNKNFPPVALKKGSTVKQLASEVHKDFIKKFKFARIWGPSAKHKGANVGLDHKLKEEDVIELHLR